MTYRAWNTKTVDRAALKELTAAIAQQNTEELEYQNMDEEWSEEKYRSVLAAQQKEAGLLAGILAYICNPVTDRLTGLANRSRYEADLRELPNSGYESVVCTYIDVVGMHEVNEHLGHRSGDTLLHSNVGNLFRRQLAPQLIAQMTNGADHLYDAEHQTHVYYYAFSNPDWFAIYTVSDAEFKEASHSESYQLQIAVAGCLLICLLCWGSLRHAINKMIVEIIALMRAGRIHAGKPGDQLRQEIQSGHRQMLEAVEASNTDALTGLFNRRCFDKALDDQLIAGRPFCLGLIDLDNFKSINDTHGHPVGDEVLRAVAREGRQIAGQEATLYRYGGEELAIIIPGEDSVRALTLLEQWRTQVAQRPWREPELVVTFSAGLGLWRQESAEQLLARVDQALDHIRSKADQQPVVSHVRSSPRAQFSTIFGGFTCHSPVFL